MGGGGGTKNIYLLFIIIRIWERDSGLGNILNVIWLSISS